VPDTTTPRRGPQAKCKRCRRWTDPGNLTTGPDGGRYGPKCARRLGLILPGPPGPGPAQRPAPPDDSPDTLIDRDTLTITEDLVPRHRRFHLHRPGTPIIEGVQFTDGAAVTHIPGSGTQPSLWDSHSFDEQPAGLVWLDEPTGPAGVTIVDDPHPAPPGPDGWRERVAQWWAGTSALTGPCFRAVYDGPRLTLSFNTMSMTPAQVDETCAWLRGHGLDTAWMPEGAPVTFDADAGTVTTRYVIPADDSDPDQEIPTSKLGPDDKIMTGEVTVPYTGALPPLPDFLDHRPAAAGTPAAAG
jgi:hypothetical protein